MAAGDHNRVGQIICAEGGEWCKRAPNVPAGHDRFVCFALYNTARPDYAFVEFPGHHRNRPWSVGWFCVQMRPNALFRIATGTERADNRFTLSKRLSASSLHLQGFCWRSSGGAPDLGWGRSLLLSGIGILFMCFMAWLLNRDFPLAVAGILCPAMAIHLMRRLRPCGFYVLPVQIGPEKCRRMCRSGCCC